MMKIAPIDAPRRELFYSFFRVQNGYELRFYDHIELASFLPVLKPVNRLRRNRLKTEHW